MANIQFRTAAVIGTGMMGPGIAATLALGGVDSTILSRTEEGAARGLDSARSQLRLLGEHGLAEADRVAWAFEHISASSDLHATVRNADLVIESAPEKMEFKQDLFAKLDSLTRPDAVLASNTSGLSITAIASRCNHPERVLTTHYWNPPHLMPLVEIVKGERTSDAVAQAVRRLLLACGKVPVVVKRDTPGQLGNRLQMALVREAIHIVEEGIADVEDVDLAAKNGFGLRLPVYGIFEHQDAVGLDMALSILDYVSRDLCNRPGAPELMQKLVREGNLGPKTGSGFYDWSKKSIEQVKAQRDAFVLEFTKSRKGQKSSEASGA
jgi:3-hydroxybutyryl-CoA dehydrogenase